MAPTRGELAAWIRCRVRAIAIAALILIGMGILGAAATLVPG